MVCTLIFGYLPSQNKNPHEKKSKILLFRGGGFIQQVETFFPPSAENPQMKVFYEEQNLRMCKFVYSSNPQPKFFRRFAPLFRGGGFYFAGVLKCQNFSYLGGGFYFTGGFY